MKKKNILMSVVGIGIGHATRSESIYNQIKNKAKVKVLSYEDAHRYFKKLNIPTNDFSDYTYKGKGFSFSILMQMMDLFKNPNKLKKDYAKFRKYADDFRPDYVFSDSEPNAFFYANNRKIRNSVLTNLVTTLTHYNIIPKKIKNRQIALQKVLLERLVNFMLKRGDKFFVPSFEKQLIYEENVQYTDLIIRKTPSELDSEKKLREKFGIDKKFYYVSVGGADVERQVFSTLESTLPKFKDKFFVVSSNHATNKIIRKDNMIIHPFIKNALEYTKLCEGIICTAGHSTISEAVVYKKPMLAIPVRNHIEQLVNASLLKKEGFGETCFFDKRVNTKTLNDSLATFFDNRDDLKKNLESVRFRGEGAQQISRYLLR